MGGADGSAAPHQKLAGDTRAAILREVQFDPISDEVLHVDFVRVDKDAEITDSVPVIFKGRAKGTTEGGVFQSLRDHLDVRGRPRDLPREIIVEVDALLVHQSIHAGDAKLPPGVTLVGSPKTLLCTVTIVKVEVVAAVPVEGGAAEPEVIGKVLAEGEEAEEGAEKGDKKDAKGEKKGDDKAAAKKPDDKAAAKAAPKKEEKKK